MKGVGFTSKNQARYVLITPARNEADYIDQLIECVLAQTVPPVSWVIVSDGSVDETDLIVKRYARTHPTIHLLRREKTSGRNFSSKVHAFRAGYERLKDVDHDFIGSLDADISFAPDYYERILAHFHSNERLGIAGGLLHDIGPRHIVAHTSLASMSGGIQMFRRRCYEDVGGYVPVRLFGEDTVAEVTARMMGWEVRVFPEIIAHHHRPTGSYSNTVLKNQILGGMNDYLLGYHPLFLFSKSLYLMLSRPYLAAGLFRLYGYLNAYLKREPRDVSEQFITFIRQEQLERLRHQVRTGLADIPRNLRVLKGKRRHFPEEPVKPGHRP